MNRTYHIAAEGIPYGPRDQVRRIAPTERFTDHIKNVLGARDIEPPEQDGEFQETKFYSGAGHGPSIIRHLP